MKLSVFQRWALAQAVGAVTGTVAEVRLGMMALEALEFSDEERERIGLEEMAGGLRWEREDRTEVELPEETTALVRAAAERWRGWPVAKAQEMEELLGLLAEGQGPEPGAA